VTQTSARPPDARSSDAIEGVATLKQEVQRDLSPTEKLPIKYGKAARRATPWLVS
jgi:hypothetical protein